MHAARYIPDCYAGAGKFFLIAALCLLPSAAVRAAEPDPRQNLSAHSPSWLYAIGKLHVPGNRFENGRKVHHREDCSATLVTSPNRGRANTLVTAWHCLEFYRDLSKPISFTALSTTGETISREVYRLADGGGMHGDWAILRLYQPIALEQITAMRIHPQGADPERPITMAGYSRDGGKGQNGEQLSYDANCHITLQARESTSSDCMAYKGASGGAVVQISETGEALYAGVISRGDSQGVSIYVPVARFRSALNQHLDQ